jgi:hypothetical protein
MSLVICETNAEGLLKIETNAEFIGSRSGTKFRTCAQEVFRLSKSELERLYQDIFWFDVLVCCFMLV